MMDFLLQQHPVLLGFMGSIFTWSCTTLGSAAVFFFKKVDNKILDAMLGFAAGIMIAASFFSLINPSIELAIQLGYIKWFPALFGFLLGAFFIYLIDKSMPDINDLKYIDKDLTRHGKNKFLLLFAITLHNFPEGISVGVAFGALASNSSVETLMAAIGLTIGIGIQDIPEGAAISLPLRRGKVSVWKSFNYGQLSGLIEILGGVLGALAVTVFTQLLPFALAFAAGTMIYVSIEELIPESKKIKDNKTPTIFAIIGFALMMFLDVSLS